MGIFRQFPYTNFHDMNTDWVIGEIKKLIEEWNSFNNDFDNWKLEVEAFMAWVKEMDISEEVRQAIEDMLDSGELAAIFAEVLDRQKGNSISLKQVALLTNFHSRNTSQAPNYSMIQSFTCDDQYFYTMGYDAFTKDADNILIKKYSADFTSVVASNMILCNHGNDCEIYNGELVICNADSTLIFVDTDTLSILRTVDLAVVNNIYVQGCYNVAVVDNLLYVGNRHTWYVVNSSMQIINTIHMNYPTDYPDAVQGMCYYNGNILRMTWPNTIQEIDLDGNIVNVFNIGPMTEDNVITETEGICVFNGQLYVTASGWCGWPTETMINQFFITDLKTGEYRYFKGQQASYSATNIYVDPQYAGVDSDGTEERPYKSASWALAVAKAHYNNVHPVYIRIMNDVPEYICAAGVNAITIYGNNHTCYGINLDGGNSVFINDLHLYANSEFDYSAYGRLFNVSNVANVVYYNSVIDGNNNADIMPFDIRSTDLKVQNWTVKGFSNAGVIVRASVSFGYVDNLDNLIPFADINYDAVIFNKNLKLQFNRSSINTFVMHEQLYEGTTAIANNTPIPLTYPNNTISNYEYLVFVINIPANGAQTFIVNRWISNFQISGMYSEGGTYYHYNFKFTYSGNDITITDQTHEGTRVPIIRRIFAIM